MDGELTKEVLKNYSEEILNWLSAMNNRDKANFLYHLESYGKIDNESEIVFDKLINGEYLPLLLSNKEYNLKRLKSYIISDAVFSLWSGINIANFKEFENIISKYKLEPINQLLLSTGYVLPLSVVLSFTFMALYHWYHYSLCNYTIEDYQKSLNQSNILKLTKNK